MLFADSIDVAQLAIWLFWAFFAGLVFYLRREDKREGYARDFENPGGVAHGFPRPPGPKTFIHRPER
jgi:photosynthetic reaction center H subunit